MRENLWRACATLALLLIGAGSASARGKIVKSTVESEGKKRSYYLLVPDSVKQGEPAPLIVLLLQRERPRRALAEAWML